MATIAGETGLSAKDATDVRRLRTRRRAALRANVGSPAARAFTTAIIATKRGAKLRSPLSTAETAIPVVRCPLTASQHAMRDVAASRATPALSSTKVYACDSRRDLCNLGPVGLPDRNWSSSSGFSLPEQPRVDWKFAAIAHATTLNLRRRLPRQSLPSYRRVLRVEITFGG